MSWSPSPFTDALRPKTNWLNAEGKLIRLEQAVEADAQADIVTRRPT